MKNVVTILVAALVFIANTVCICAASPRADQVINEIASGASLHCDSKRSEGSCHGHSDGERPGDEDQQSHSCGHCTGTVSIDVAQPKSVSAPLLLSPILCPLPLHDFLNVRPLHSVPLVVRAQPPPVSPPTLFSLACLLTI